MNNLKHQRGLWKDGNTTRLETYVTKEQLVHFIVFQLSHVYLEDSAMARMAKKGLMKLSADELQALNLLVYTSKERINV